MALSLIYHTPESSTGGISPFDAAVMGMVAGQELMIACPYLGLDYLVRMTQPAVGWRLLTDLVEWLLSQTPATRARVVDFVAAHPGAVRHCAELHAKVLVAGSKAMLGSANFTERGILKRVEVSVLVDEPDRVGELKAWFNSVWDHSSPVSETDLRSWLSTAPPREQTPVSPLPGKFPRVRAKFAALEPACDPEIAAVMSRCTTEVRDLVEELRSLLESEGVSTKSTRTAGGDIRCFFKRVNFAEIRLQRAAVLLRLRLGAGAVADGDLVWNKGTHDSADIAQVRLPAGQPVPPKVSEWIEKAKAYTLEEFG